MSDETPTRICVTCGKPIEPGQPVAVFRGGFGERLYQHKPPKPPRRRPPYEFDDDEPLKPGLGSNRPGVPSVDPPEDYL